MDNNTLINIAKVKFTGLMVIGLFLVFVLVLAGASNVRAGDLHVPADYATIQAAADAAVDGDTIHIAPGVYSEQAHIRNNVTVQGQPGTILRAFPNMADLGFGWRNILLINGPTNVILRELTFEGDQLAYQQPTNEVTGVQHGTRGVYIVDCGGAVENCQFTGFRGPQSLSGVVAEDNPLALDIRNDLPGAPLYDFRIAGNTFVDSIEAFDVHGTPDPNQVSLNVTIENNVVQGIGPTDVGESSSLLTGIDIGRGVTGTVVGNTVSGFSYNGTNALYKFGAGILLSSSTDELLSVPPFRFENNVLRKNDVHIMIIKSDQSQIVNNRFEGIGESDFYRGGVFFSGTDVTVQGNKFMDMPLGLTAWGDDPIYGLFPGIATNAVITDNQFCNVDTNYEFQPLATYDLQSTLTCPEPTLDMVQAILLTWPFNYDGYSVEFADSPDGPWSPLDATVFMHNGMHSVIVPADGAPEFFRLVKP